MDETKKEVLQFPRLNGFGGEPTCKDCVFFSVKLNAITEGFCHGNPPSFVGTTREGIPVFARPSVGADNQPCRFLIARPRRATEATD